MDAYESIISRRSIRSFSKDVPSKELVMKVVEAGRRAPSGMNTQLWHFTVVLSREKIRVPMLMDLIMYLMILKNI